LLEIAKVEEEAVANPHARHVTKPDCAPPPVDGDFYRIASVLNDKERTLLRRVRGSTEDVVAPVIEGYWAHDEFPFEIVSKMAEIGIGGVGHKRYGAAGGSWLLNGFVAMELARLDSSVATFWGMHTGLNWRVPY
jgi:glutaryl-CoA dehydrogenase